MEDDDYRILLDEFDYGIDWNYLSDTIPENASLFENNVAGFTDSSTLENPSPDDGLSSLSIGEVEDILMRDDDYAGAEIHDSDFVNEFIADVFVDSPVDSQSGHVVAVSDEKKSDLVPDHRFWDDDVVAVRDDKSLVSDVSDGSEVKIVGSEDVDKIVNVDDDDADDPISLKRKRQMRNRDAAVRSRERKKMHMRDLELKTKYLEGECRRLGQLLHYCYAENQTLRLQLHTGSEASGAFMNKQESAVLLLESLLLGSLLWFMGILCLFHLPNLPQFPKQEVVVNRNQENVAPKRTRNKTFGSLLTSLCMNSRRCKASRTRMKPSLLSLLVPVLNASFSSLPLFSSFVLF